MNHLQSFDDDYATTKNYVSSKSYGMENQKNEILEISDIDEDFLNMLLESTDHHASRAKQSLSHPSLRRKFNEDNETEDDSFQLSVSEFDSSNIKKTHDERRSDDSFFASIENVLATPYPQTDTTKNKDKNVISTYHEQHDDEPYSNQSLSLGDSFLDN